MIFEIVPSDPAWWWLLLLLLAPLGLVFGAALIVDIVTDGDNNIMFDDDIWEVLAGISVIFTIIGACVIPGVIIGIHFSDKSNAISNGIESFGYRNVIESGDIYVASTPQGEYVELIVRAQDEPNTYRIIDITPGKD